MCRLVYKINIQINFLNKYVWINKIRINNTENAIIYIKQS